MTFSVGLAAMSSSKQTDIGTLKFLGLGVWVIGFLIEVVGDRFVDWYCNYRDPLIKRVAVFDFGGTVFCLGFVDSG